MTEATAAGALSSTPQIFPALVAIAGELAKLGIAKDRRNETQNFRFRGIDDVMNAVSPILAKHEVVFLVQYEDYPDVERVTAKGATLIYTKVKGLFTFVSAKDGSHVTVTTFGVAMDTGDKACNKAMSAALKYALLQAFLIPTESTDDADATTPEPSVVKPPDGFDAWFADLVAGASEGVTALKAAWGKSPEAFREYAMQYRDADWKAAKTRAVAADRALADQEAAEAPPEQRSPTRPRRTR